MTALKPVVLQCFHNLIFFSFSASDALKGEGLQEGVDWLQGISYVILLLSFHSVKLFHFVRVFFFIISFVFFLSISAVRSNYTVSTDASSHICLSFTSLTYTMLTYNLSVSLTKACTFNLVPK